MLDKDFLKSLNDIKEEQQQFRKKLAEGTTLFKVVFTFEEYRYSYEIEQLNRDIEPTTDHFKWNNIEYKDGRVVTIVETFAHDKNEAIAKAAMELMLQHELDVRNRIKDEVEDVREEIVSFIRNSLYGITDRKAPEYD